MFRNIWLAASMAVGLAAASVAVAEVLPKPPSAEDFARDPDISPPRISPDGKALAFIRGNAVVILDLKTEEEKTLAGGQNRLGEVEWVNNDYVVAYIKDEEVPDFAYVKKVNYSPLVITRTGRFVRPLFERNGKVSPEDLKPVLRYIDGPEPYAITFGPNYTYQTEIGTGKWKVGPRLMEGHLFFFDRQGMERVAVQFLDGKPSYGISDWRLRYRTVAGGRPAELHFPTVPDTYAVQFHYGEADNAVFWTEFNYKTGQATLWRYGLATGEKTVFRSGTSRDLDLVFDKDGRVTGVTTLADRVQTDWIDPYRKKLTEAIQALYPTAMVTVGDLSQDGKIAILRISAPDAGDSYNLYNAETRELVLIGDAYPQLGGHPLGEMTYVTYKARDGLDIPAYVTKLKGTPGKAPLIVMPHGGPAARDVYGFNYMAQFLASRGYVVLQPQYRGSAGFGDAFERAGNKHLDLMATDLEDGVRYLAAQGTIDPAKVCIMGWSWGGYLTEAALTETPGTYACGVSGAGISDLIKLLQTDNDYFWGGYTADYLENLIGGQMTDGAKIHAVNPIEHVDAIRAPLMLIHGEGDRTVNYHQSEDMNAAMTKAGRPVTYLSIKYMHHGPGTYEERVKVLKAMDDFIATALKGAAPAPKP